MIIVNEYPKDKFMGTYKIDDKICDEIIEYFNKNNHLHRKGHIGSGDGSVDKSIKDSIDIAIDTDRYDHPFLNYRVALKQCFDNYADTYKEVKEYHNLNVAETLNIQYYKPKSGYKKYHFENCMADTIQSARVLVYMTYLNDVSDGGTEFLYQNIKTKAQKGLTLIWPAHFTHTHRGIISDTAEKYIITGWISKTNE